MTFVITELCVGVKDGTCVDVCPMDCIHPGPAEREFAGADQLYIHPEVCIDCNVCVAVCPADAIFAEDELPGEYQPALELNARYYAGAAAGP